MKSLVLAGYQLTVVYFYPFYVSETISTPTSLHLELLYDTVYLGESDFVFYRKYPYQILQVI